MVSLRSKRLVVWRSFVLTGFVSVTVRRLHSIAIISNGWPSLVYSFGSLASD